MTQKINEMNTRVCINVPSLKLLLIKNSCNKTEINVSSFLKV